MLKIIILFLSLASNIFIGIKILKKHRGIKNKANIYFAFMCFIAGLWTIIDILILFTQNNNISIALNQLVYFCTTLIIICFLLFSIEFPYKLFKIPKLIYYILTSISLLIFYIIFSKNFIIKHYYYNKVLYQVVDINLNLIYGIYFIILLILALSILIKKYILAQGINKQTLKNILIATTVPYILGVFFAWYLPYIGKHSYDWLGAVSAILMNASIAYLIFKKD